MNNITHRLSLGLQAIHNRILTNRYPTDNQLNNRTTDLASDESCTIF
ncbi:TPA: hypothetical protein ON591_001432 [Citrobacter freundii]|nr:hypothetical protein [Citrobacter freundii]HBB6884814.1 hypothetical protein [Citrobacter freundii]HCL6507099.1 hypothetical protein [Citrobacter freundii]HCR3475475.1 hypothetical protein [Citrobacter freundii]HCR4091963.1 hypothetical protein [Citrobacter freundii]